MPFYTLRFVRPVLWLPIAWEDQQDLHNPSRPKLCIAFACVVLLVIGFINLNGTDSSACLAHFQITKTLQFHGFEGAENGIVKLLPFKFCLIYGASDECCSSLDRSKGTLAGRLLKLYSMFRLLDLVLNSQTRCSPAIDVVRTRSKETFTITTNSA